MQIRILLCAMLLTGFIFQQSYAQDTARVEIDHFRMPTTPAAGLLNMGTHSIARPTTSQGVVTSLLSGFGGNGINPNIGIEFTPYWLKARRSLSFEQFYGLTSDGVSEKDIGENLLRSLAISVATTKLGDRKDTLPGTRMSIGARAQLFSGKASQKILADIRNLDITLKSYDIIKAAISVLKRMQDIRPGNNADTNFTQLQATLLPVITSLADRNPSLTASSKQYLIEKAAALLAKKIREATDKGLTPAEGRRFIENALLDKKEHALEIQKLGNSDKNRVGFIWELGLAAAQYFPDNNFNRSTFNKMGVWSTMSHRSENQKNEFSFLARYLFSKQDSVSSNFDMGISATRIVDKGFNYGFEFIFRAYDYRYQTKDLSGKDITAIQSGSTYRLALNMEYKISEVVSLTAAIGRDFEGPFVTKGNLLNVIGANFSLPTKASIWVPK